MISRLTGGSYEAFDAGNTLNWSEKIADLMDKVCQPAAIEDIRIEWQNMRSEEQAPVEGEFTYCQAPTRMRVLFSGRRVVAYGFIPNCRQATLRARINGYELSAVVTCPELGVTQGDVVHKLTAKALIDDWQQGVLHDTDQVRDALARQKLKQRLIRKINLAYYFFPIFKTRKYFILTYI